MKCSLIIIAWFGVLVTAVFLRFEELEVRPFHADEATGAKITAQRMESDGWVFDPIHYHGPILSDLAMGACRLRGEDHWESMTKYGLRLVPAVAGVLLVLLPLGWRRRMGDPAALLIGVLLATSPLLVYYSRMFIHEMLLVLFGLAAVVVLTTFKRRGLAGAMMGLMFAAKESVAISVLAWGAAAAVLVFEERRSIPWHNPRGLLSQCWKWGWPLVVPALITSMVFYTQGFTYWQGAVDSVKTYFVYETVDGHDKPWWYYFGLLVIPQKSGGLWWYGTPVVVLALIAYVRSFSPEVAPAVRRTIRFLAYGAVGHLAIYSMFAYKTPWLACLPWVHVCCLAGFAAVGWATQSRVMRMVVIVVACMCLVSQWRQTRMASGRFSSDARNPFAYVPTHKKVAVMESWLNKLQSLERAPAWSGVAVVGSGYWPLPWYVRDLDAVGYWPQVPENVSERSIIIAMPEQAEKVSAMTADSHLLQLYSLRNEVPLHVFIRLDLAKAWEQRDEP